MAKLLLPTFVVAGALLGAITPAMAREAASPKPEATVGTESKTRICVVQPAVTGSILDHRTCKTRAQWLADGVDIDKVIASSR